MFKNILEAKGVVFLRRKSNRYSINVLVAALDVQHFKKEIKIIDESNKDTIRKLKSEGYLIIDSFSTLDFLNIDPIADIVGGPHPTADPVGSLKYFNFVFVGEGEISLFEFLERGISKGLAFREGETLYFTGRSRATDINQFPSFPWWRNMLGPIEIQRGCNFNCRYCAVPYLFGKSRYRSIESIEEHIRNIVKLGRRDVRFIAPNSFEHPELLEIIDLKKKYKGIRLFIGSFPSEVRPEFVEPEILAELKGKVCNKRIIIGAQSGSERMLKLMNRKHDVSDVLNAVEICIKYSFIPEVDFIIGNPFEIEEDLYETLNVCREIIKMGGRIHLHYFMPLPGSSWEDKKPTVVPHKILKEFEKLVGKGFLYGEWKKQMEISFKITDLYEKNIILGKRGLRFLRFL